MNWKELLKAQGYTDEEISNMEKTFGGEKMAKAFEAPLKAAADAKALADKANADLAEFESKYQTEILPEISKTYRRAIDAETQVGALTSRLKAAKDYGFLSEDIADPNKDKNTPPPNSNEVPGSPALDSRYVPADAFTKAVNDIPDMLGRLTNMSNEHFSLFGSPLLDVNDMIAESKKTNGKKSVYDIWNDRYKVEDKRKQIAADKQAAHDKSVGEKAVQDYLTQHGGTPFTRPGVPSIANRFSPAGKDDARHPWKGAADRRQERRNTFAEASAKSRMAGAA